MMLARVTLESFETVDENPPPESPEFLRGFEAGQQAAAQQAEEDSERALSAIAATLSDMSFGFAEAHAHLMEKLTLLLAQVAENVLPEILKESFSAYLMDAIQTNFDAVSVEPVEIAVAPDILESLASVLSQDGAGRFAFAPDPSLCLGQATLRQGETHFFIDLPSVVEELQTALRGLETIERTSSHG